MSDEEDVKRQEKDVIRQESFWFTVTTLAFTGFVGGLLQSPSVCDAIVSFVLIFVLWLFTFYLLIGRYQKYRELNNQPVAGLWAALRSAIKEKSGTLYCVGIVTFSMIGFSLITYTRLIKRLCEP
jgi:hypothetical protein